MSRRYRGNRYRSLRSRTHINDSTVGTIMLIVLGVIVFSTILFFTVLQRHNKSVVVENKWWATETRVTYQTTDCSVQVDSEGFSSIHCSTSTNTRCKTEQAGLDLPISFPKPGCEVRRNDSIKNRNWYMIAYRISETNETHSSWLNLTEWDNIELLDFLEVHTYGLSSKVHLD